jgi:GT2 family glycosyltransferase
MKISVLTPTIRTQGLEVIRIGLLQQTFKDFEFLTEVGLEKHDLNAAYNRMLKRAKGELVVSLQDYSLIKPDYLQKWWGFFQANPNTFMTAPVGKTGLTYNDPKWDWRKSRSGEVNWREWEIDNGAAPLVALRQIGGFDEALDGHWSLDNVNVGCRANLAGFKFKCVDNPVLAYDHDKDIPHPFRNTFDGTFNTKRMIMFEAGMTLPPF